MKEFKSGNILFPYGASLAQPGETGTIPRRALAAHVTVQTAAGSVICLSFMHNHPIVAIDVPTIGLNVNATKRLDLSGGSMPYCLTDNGAPWLGSDPDSAASGAFESEAPCFYRLYSHNLLGTPQMVLIAATMTAEFERKNKKLYINGLEVNYESSIAYGAFHGKQDTSDTDWWSTNVMRPQNGTCILQTYMIRRMIHLDNIN